MPAISAAIRRRCFTWWLVQSWTAADGVSARSFLAARVGDVGDVGGVSGGGVDGPPVAGCGRVCRGVGKFCCNFDVTTGTSDAASNSSLPRIESISSKSVELSAVGMTCPAGGVTWIIVPHLGQPSSCPIADACVTFSRAVQDGQTSENGCTSLLESKKFRLAMASSSYHDAPQRESNAGVRVQRRGACVFA